VFREVFVVTLTRLGLWSRATLPGHARIAGPHRGLAYQAAQASQLIGRVGHSCAASEGRRMVAGLRRGVDVAVICALQIEREAVCRALGLTRREHRVMVDERRYWRGVRSFGGRGFDIVVAQLPDMSNTPAAVWTTQVIHQFRPRAMLFIGIAAATSSRQRLGDVVVGKAVYYEESGKQTAQGKLHDPDVIRADQKLLDVARSATRWSGRFWMPRPDRSNDKVAEVSIGVIVSGEEVIADEARRDAIKNRKRSASAIEMEGYGFSYAALQSTSTVKHLVIRGLCDYANAKKNDKWHPYAAAAAAHYARHLLADWPYPTVADRAAPSRKREVEPAAPVAVVPESAALRPVTILNPNASGSTISPQGGLEDLLSTVSTYREAMTRAVRSGAGSTALVRHYASRLSDVLDSLAREAGRLSSLDIDVLGFVDTAALASDHAKGIADVPTTSRDLAALVDDLDSALDTLVHLPSRMYPAPPIDDDDR
jgi:nucleoside phosphorylase